MRPGRWSFALEELCPRDRSSHQRAIAGHLAGDPDSGLVDRLRLFPVAGTGQFFTRTEEGQGLEYLGTCVQELAVKLAQHLGMLDGNLGRELTAATPRTNFLTL